MDYLVLFTTARHTFLYSIKSTIASSHYHPHNSSCLHSILISHFYFSFSPHRTIPALCYNNTQTPHPHIPDGSNSPPRGVTAPLPLSLPCPDFELPAMVTSADYWEAAYRREVQKREQSSSSHSSSSKNVPNGSDFASSINHALQLSGDDDGDEYEDGASPYRGRGRGRPEMKGTQPANHPSSSSSSHPSAHTFSSSSSMEKCATNSRKSTAASQDPTLKGQRVREKQNTDACYTTHVSHFPLFLSFPPIFLSPSPLISSHLLLSISHLVVSSSSLLSSTPPLISSSHFLVSSSSLISSHLFHSSSPLLSSSHLLLSTLFPSSHLIFSHFLLSYPLFLFSSPLIFLSSPPLYHSSSLFFSSTI